MASDADKRELVTKMTAYVKRRFGGTGLDSWKRAFASADRNGDGQISASELQAMLKSAGIGNFLTLSAWTDGVMKELDKDAGNTLSFAELRAVLVSPAQDAPIPWSVPPEPKPEPIPWSVQPEAQPAAAAPQWAWGAMMLAVLFALRR